MKQIIFYSILILASFKVNASHNNEKIYKSYVDYVNAIENSNYDQIEEYLIQFKKNLTNSLLTDVNKAITDLETMNKEFSNFYIVKSDNNRFITINWDDLQGGTMRNFEGLYVYQLNDKWTVEDMSQNTNNDCCMGSLTYAINAIPQKNGNTVYLLFQQFIASNSITNYTIKTVTISKNKLDTNAKFIKTTSGLNNSVNYSVDWIVNNNTSNVDYENTKSTYNKSTQEFSFPVIHKNGKITSSKIKYKFKESYFEKN